MKIKVASYIMISVGFPWLETHENHENKVLQE